MLWSLVLYARVVSKHSKVCKVHESRPRVCVIISAHLERQTKPTLQVDEGHRISLVEFLWIQLEHAFLAASWRM
jgi:hypothetical protein